MADSSENVNPAGTRFSIEIDHFKKKDIFGSEGPESVRQLAVFERRFPKKACFLICSVFRKRYKFKNMPFSTAGEAIRAVVLGVSTFSKIQRPDLTIRYTTIQDKTDNTMQP